MTELLTDNLRVEAQTDGVVMEPEYLGYLRANGYPVDDVRDLHLVESDSRDVAHLVCRVTTTDKPKVHPESDILADETTIPVCSCEDYRYNKSVDVASTTLEEGHVGSCKHIRSAYRAEQAKHDDQQATLK